MNISQQSINKPQNGTKYLTLVFFLLTLLKFHYKSLRADMRKAWQRGSVATGCGNFLKLRKFSPCNTKFFSICLKYWGDFNHITQIVHSSAHLNPLKGIFSEKLLIIVEILIFQFAEIFNTWKTWPRKVLNFSHVCDFWPGTRLTTTV